MKDIKVGIVGLGRLGSVHAQNLSFKIPGCKLVAACSLEQKELDWAKDYLKVEYTTTDYKKMVDEADIEAVVIVSSSPEHCWMIEYALDAGKHVFTDKPLGCSLEECKRAEAAVERHPDKLFFLGLRPFWMQSMKSTISSRYASAKRCGKFSTISWRAPYWSYTMTRSFQGTPATRMCASVPTISVSVW